MTFPERTVSDQVSTLAALFLCNYGVVTYLIKMSNGKFK